MPKVYPQPGGIRPANNMLRILSYCGNKAALLEIAKLAEDHKLAKLILHYYEMILDGCSLLKLMTEAEKQKHKNMQAVV